MYDWEATPSGVTIERFSRLPSRIRNALIRHGFRSWEQVAATADAEFLSWHRVGPKGLTAIREEQRLQRL